MSVINKELYDALILAKVPEEKAASAAQPLETQDIRSDISQMKADIAGIKANITILKWMFGLIFAAVVVPLIKSFLG